jgi:lysophospholipase L1-like esterase
MGEPSDLYVPARAEPFRYRLSHFADRLKVRGPIKIVAIGSSSTAGEGDIVPYPYRLQGALRAKYPERMIDVLNRGIGGQEAPEETLRMQADVIDEAPTLVIWQVGTNAVWQQADRKFEVVVEAIKGGLDLLGKAPIDVVMMDLQYAPAILTQDKIKATVRMLSAIDELAAAANVNVFRRFDLMRKFLRQEGHSFDHIINPADNDRLHQSDWAAQRIGYELSETIAAAAVLGPSAA